MVTAVFENTIYMKFCYTKCYNVVGIFKAMIKFMGLLNLFDFMTFSNYFLTFFSLLEFYSGIP